MKVRAEAMMLVNAKDEEAAERAADYFDESHLADLHWEVTGTDATGPVDDYEAHEKIHEA